MNRMVSTPSQVATAPAASLGWSRLPADYAIPATAPSPEQAREYCCRLARSHYENFSVATWFLPGRLRQHFCNVYAYCRISDDLGDEVGDTGAALALLNQWEAELNACYDGHPKHPVFVALAEAVDTFNSATPAFSGLLRASQWFHRRLPLVEKVDRELAIRLELFSRGGQEILNSIERQKFAVLGQRPAISKPRKLALVARAALGKLLVKRRGQRI